MNIKSKPPKHYTASILIMTEEEPVKTLLLTHPKLNTWMCPGGHQESFENPLEAAIREAEEETGLDISAYFEAAIPLDDRAHLLPMPKYILEVQIAPHGDDEFHYHTDMVYSVRIPQKSLVHRRRESHELRWFTAEELDTLSIFKNLRLLLKKEMAGGGDE